MEVAWTAVVVTRRGYFHRRRLADHVIAELARWGNKNVTHGITGYAQQFMSNDGMDEDTALVAAYTFCVSFTNMRN